MYVAVRRYEGVTDPRKVGQLVDEGFVPIIGEIPLLTSLRQLFRRSLWPIAAAR
jgi:hypothetical protein